MKVISLKAIYSAPNPHPAPPPLDSLKGVLGCADKRNTQDRVWYTLSQALPEHCQARTQYPNESLGTLKRLEFYP